MNQPRIILLIENMSFPRDRRVRHEAAALVRVGCDVSVVCPKGKTQDSRGFEVIDNVKVYRYWQPWQGKRKLGYLVEYVWAMLWSFLIVAWIWVKDGFDVLHVANPPDLFFLVAAPFLFFGKKFVYDQHDLCPELFEFKFGKTLLMGRILLLLEHCSYRLADLVIVTNQSYYATALERGARLEKLSIVRNGPDLDYFVDIATSPTLKDGGQYMALYVGAVGPQDGVERIVKAAHHTIHNRGRRDVKFAILGDGDYLKHLKYLAHTLNVEQYINFAGWVGDVELLSYLSTADVCLAPEAPGIYNQRSTFMKLAEYMSYGKVTVSFDLLESRRTLGSSGIYVNGDDPALFGDAILEILDAPELRQKLGQVAAERVRTLLHWGLSRGVLLEAYEKVVWNGTLGVEKERPAEDIACR